MRPTIPALALLLAAAPAAAKTVESFQIATGNEALLEGRELSHFENSVWVQKSWTNFERSVNTLYLGTELLVEPFSDGATGGTAYGRDLESVFLGYKLRTYLPDWYSLNVRLRIPVDLPADPFGRTYCGADEPEPPPGAPPPSCAPHRSFFDRLQLRVDPLLVQKAWNLFTLYDRNRVTVATDAVEYGNKLKLIDTIPDLEFPIATYVGTDLRLKKSYGDGGRVRDDLLVGMASNLSDWAHVGIEMKYRLDTDPEQHGAFLAEVYVELLWDVYFDNTFGASEREGRTAATEARD